MNSFRPIEGHFWDIVRPCPLIASSHRPGLSRLISSSQSFIGTGAVLFGEMDAGASSAGRGRGNGSDGAACGGTPVSAARCGSGGGGRSPKPWLNQSAIAEAAVNCGTCWASAQTQANSKKNKENVATLDTVTRSIFAPHSTLPVRARLTRNKAMLRRIAEARRIAANVAKLEFSKARPSGPMTVALSAQRKCREVC